MHATQVQVRRVSKAPSTLEQDIVFAETLARLLDSQFQMGTVRFGMDALLGLIPVIGDAISLAMGLYPAAIARKHGLGKTVVARMLLNLGVDFVVGSVPLIGDAFDVFNKANLKNLKLLKRAAEKKQTRHLI